MFGLSAIYTTVSCRRIGIKAGMVERRQSRRTTIFRGAKILSSGCPMFRCIVRNLTSRGACFLVGNAANLPTEFALSFDGGYTLRNCILVWKTTTDVGVAFKRSGGQPRE
jgi:hypothetical protein